MTAGQFLTLMARRTLWVLATLLIAGLIALISMPAAFFSGAVALAVGWWFRSQKTIGTVFGAGCLIGGVIWFFVQPGTPHPPVTSCSVYPIPFVQRGSPLPVVYERTAMPLPKDPKPWVSTIPAETYLQLSFIDGAEQRIQQARMAAIAHARDTGEAQVALDSLLEQADARLKEQQPWNVGAIRQTLEGRAKALAKTAATADAFRTAWQADEDVRRVASVALVLTNLDNEIAKLFTGLQSSQALSVAVRGRDLVYRDTLTLTATGGTFSKINPSPFLDAARQSGLSPSLLWSAGTSRLETAPGGVLTLPAGTRSVTLAVEWTEQNGVVDTCRRMSALAFQGATIRVPGSYAATVRGEAIPMSKSEPVPVAVSFTAAKAVRQLVVPAYSLFVASRPMTAADPTAPNDDEQVLTLAQPVTEASAQTAPLWIEMLPAPFRAKIVQRVKDTIFPANAAITLMLLGVATLVSVRLAR